MHSNPLKRREFCTGWATLGYQSRPGAPEQVAPFLKADTEVIKEAGIAPQD